MKKIIISTIKLYQITLSPDHGWLSYKYPYGYCRYHPTCSEYAKQTVEENGAVRGILFSLKRLLRCHPWAVGGYDPVRPKSHKLKPYSLNSNDL